MELAAGGIVGGRYRLERLLGEGGMGVVWLATHTLTSKSVALKFLQGEEAREPKVRARFLREARAASAVRHPNVVEIHDVIELEDGTPAMVMEFLDGESLGARLERTRAVPLGELAQILVPVCDAVAAAHAAGVVHRDLKPDNIFIAKGSDGKERIKVLDFGIAKMTTHDAASTASLTNTGAMLGTPYYMAPEQIFGERDIDRRADIWALGIIVFEGLTGARPTDGENVGQIMKVIMTGRITAIEKVAPNVPADIAAIVGRCLKLERSERPASVGELRDVLLRHTGNMTVISTVPFSRSSLSDAHGIDALSATVQSGDQRQIIAGTLATTTQDSDVVRLRKRRSSWRVAGAAAVVAIAAALGVFVLLHKPAVAPATPPVVKPSEARTAIEPVATTVSATTVSAPVIVTPTSSAPAVSSAKPVASTKRVTLPAVSAPVASATTSAKPTTSVNNMGGVVDKPPF